MAAVLGATSRRTLVWLSAACAAVACVKKQTGGGDLDPRDTLRVNLITEPPTVDWTKTGDTVSGTVIDNLMDGLLDLDLGDPELKPRAALATSWRQTNGARTWIFKLRAGVRWTDGAPFTGQQVIDGWERLLNPANASPSAYFLFPIKNARRYSSGETKDFSTVGVTLTAPDELRVELDQPMGYFPLLVTHASTFPVRKDLIDRFGDGWSDPKHLETLGAYRLKSWAHDENVILERFDGYYGEKAKIKNVLFYMINEFSTALNLVDSGRLDLQMDLPAKELSYLRTKSGYRQVNSFGNFYYGFNVTKQPFDDVRVRKAFVMAVDRRQITDLLAAGNTPLTGWIPLGLLGYDAARGLPFDPARARRLLSEAGFGPNHALPRVVLASNTNENQQRVAENVQAQLKKNLNVAVELQNQDFKSYLARLTTDAPQIYRMGWIADFPDPATFTSLMTSYSESNHTRWKSKTYDDLHAEASRTLDRGQRRRIYARLQKVLNEDEVPVMPIYSWVDHYMISDRVQDLPLTAARSYPFKGVSFK